MRKKEERKEKRKEKVREIQIVSIETMTKLFDVEMLTRVVRQEFDEILEDGTKVVYSKKNPDQRVEYK